MALKSLVRYAIPLSFVYCTIYQQDIWREGDEKLFLEQRRTWRKFFNLVDESYHRTINLLNLSNGATHRDPNTRLLARLDSMNLTECYNAKVSCAFSTLDKLVTNPMALGCKVYRTILPYISSTESK